MIRKHAIRMTALAFCLSGAVAAQDGKPPAMTPEMQAQMAAYAKAGTPGEAHRYLASTAGAYDLTFRVWMAPGAPPSTETGKATRKMILGERALVEEVTGTMMGQAYTGHGMYGYDNTTGKYWATWIDSMSTAMMTSEGTCDAKHACTFTGSSVDPLTKKTQSMRMTTRWTDADTEVFEMYGPGPDGKEAKMMEITYKRNAG